LLVCLSIYSPSGRASLPTKRPDRLLLAVTLCTAFLRELFKTLAAANQLQEVIGRLDLSLRHVRSLARFRASQRAALDALQQHQRDRAAAEGGNAAQRMHSHLSADELCLLCKPETLSARIKVLSCWHCFHQPLCFSYSRRQMADEGTRWFGALTRQASGGGWSFPFYLGLHLISGCVFFVLQESVAEEERLANTRAALTRQEAESMMPPEFVPAPLNAVIAQGKTPLDALDTVLQWLVWASFEK